MNASGRHYKRGQCECCGIWSKRLIIHHWFQPPVDGDKYFRYHTKRVCLSCNTYLQPTNFWAVPVLDHILPDWETQVQYIRGFGELGRDLSQLSWEARLRSEEQRRAEITRRYLRQLPICATGIWWRYQGGWSSEKGWGTVRGQKWIEKKLTEWLAAQEGVNDIQ